MVRPVISASSWPICAAGSIPPSFTVDSRLHDARHTTITLLAQAGIPRGIIALVVGHDDPAFTERVYTHIDTETARRASSALEGVLGRRSTPGPIG
jgi:integrase